jgi:hypothetical protein
MHTWTPFTTELHDLALAQSTRLAGVDLYLNTIGVTEDLASVPTLSQWGLLLCSGLAALALVVRRNCETPR